MSDLSQADEAWRALGRQLSACRKAAGLSQERLARLADYSRSTVANVETGRQRVGADFWARCDDVLGTVDALRRAFGEVQLAEQSEREQAVIQARYDSLAATAGHPGSYSDAAGRTEDADDAQFALEIGSARDPLVVEWLAEILTGHARTAGMFGGRDLLPLMMRHVRFLRAGIGSARGGDAGRLAAVGARYAEFAGWLHQDLGQFGDAVFWTDRALVWAQQAEDRGFESYVLMRQSDLAEGQRPAKAVLGLARAAARVPVLGPRSRALVRQQLASGHALDADAVEFERMIEQARADVDAASVSGDAPWGLYCTSPYLAMQEATGWMRLGQVDRAVTVFEREIVRLPSSDRMDGGLFRARLARAYAASGRPEQAARAGLAASELAEVTGSLRTLRELAQVRRMIGSNPQGEVAARFVAVCDARTKPARASSGQQ
jgi:transcriptional regulator with XRE-family HTH domain